MSSIVKFLGAITAGMVAATPAFAVGTLPEPGTIGLVAVGVAGLVFLARRKK